METKLELLRCEDEPIHIPNLIQPIGYLLVVNIKTYIVTAASANSYELSFRNVIGDILGKNICDLIPDIASCLVDFGRSLEHTNRKLYFNIQTMRLAYHYFDIFVSSKNKQEIIIELIRKPKLIEQLNPLDSSFHTMTQTLLKSPSLHHLYHAITAQMREISSFDRVLLYKFDEAYNGQVISESKIDGMESYLNLHFPASDIPAQARELYLKNKIRIIEDAYYVPTKLESLEQETLYLDMSYSFLRSVSPFHLEYMKNMGTRASMTISLIVDNKLWGLIACHHNAKYMPTMELVGNCEQLSIVVSSLIKLLEDKEREVKKSKFLGKLETIIFILRQSIGKQSLSNNIGEHLVFFKSLFECDSMMYINKGDIKAIDTTLSFDKLQLLASKIKKLNIETFFVTTHLQSHIDLEADILTHCSGVVVVKMPSYPELYFVWMKIERIQTINWGGDPTSAISKQTLSPRLSFEKFTQTIQGTSLAWSRTIEDKIQIFVNRIEEIIKIDLSNKKIAEQKHIIKNLEEEKAKNFAQLIDMLVAMIEERDAYTAGHTLRVARYSTQIAVQMGLDWESIALLEQSAKLHDIGKVVIPDSVLLKPGKLNEIEYSLIQLHLNVGYEMLSKIDYYKPIAEIMRYHHERYDGTGYPYKLKGDEIPLLSSIMAVADSLDAMTSNRIYQKRKTLQRAIDEIVSLKGKSYHPEVVDALVSLYQNNQIDIEYSIQLPLTQMEHERFSYFFKDNMTGFFNEPYLWMILNNQIPNLKPEYFAIIELHGMSQYNQLHGWHTGNILINNIAKLIKKIYEKHYIFRVYGDDFAICFTNQEEFDFEFGRWHEVKIGNVFTTIRKIDKVDFIQEMQSLW